MKTLTILFLLIAAQANAQWQTDVRLTNNTAASNTSGNNAWCIASNPFIVSAVWQDERDGNKEIYCKRSSDGGISWGTDMRLTNNFSESEDPSVAISNMLTMTVHVVWQDLRYGYHAIFYKRSVGGLNWEADSKLSVGSQFTSKDPSVSASGSNVHVVWYDTRHGFPNDEIYYIRSTNAGVNWGANIRMTNNSSYKRYPSVSSYDSDVHVVWQDFRNGNSEIYYKRSTNAGVGWETEKRLTNDTADSYPASVSASGSVVHVVWHDLRDINAEIYYKRSTNRGVNWGADTRLTNNSAGSGFPSVKSFGSAVHVVWYDTRDGNTEIYYKRSTNGGVNWSADTRLTNNTYASAYPSVAVALSTVHVVWQDFRNGNYEIYYKRNPTGNPVGITNINSELPKEFSLGQNYPNPFNPSTVIGFQLTVNSFTSLKIYDMLGKEIATLVNEELKPGIYEVDFDGTNYSSGVYYYRLVTGDYSETKKMILIK